MVYMYNTLLCRAVAQVAREKNIPTLSGRDWGWALRGHSGLGHWALRETLELGTPGLGTPGTFWGWAIQETLGLGNSGTLYVGHCRETLALGTLGRLWSRETLGTPDSGLGTPGRLWGWALQGHSTVELGAPGTLWGLGTPGMIEE